MLELVDDEADEVLAACTDAFHDTSLDRFAGSVEFLDAYARSGAFRRHPSALLHRLRDHPGSLVPFASCILAVCQSLAESMTGDIEHRQRTFWEADYYLPVILLRLYEQASAGSAVREHCLDAWDLLLRNRVLQAASLTKQVTAE